MAKTFGLAVEVLSPQDIAGMYPLLNLDSVTGGVFLPKDGQADPANITHALAKAARQNGVAIVEHCKVTGIAQANGRVKIGRASCRERVCQYGLISVVAGSLKKKK